MINYFTIASPLEQFELVTILPISIFGLNISLTNSSLFLFLTFSLSIFWISLSFYKNTLIPNNWQLIKEYFYDITASIVQDNLGSKGEFYFPFIFTLHLVLLYCNLIGMVPYSFTVTSHIVFTFTNERLCYHPDSYG